MYAGKCKHGVIVAGCVGPKLSGHRGTDCAEMLDFAEFMKDLLDRGLTVSNEDSVTLVRCIKCMEESVEESVEEKNE